MDTAEAGADRPAADRPAADRPAADRPAADRPAADLPRVRIVDACKHFGQLEAVRHASLTVQRGEVVLVIGPSGSGKSTLLRCVNRLEHLNSGDIWIDDECVSDPRADARHIREEVGMVFQSFNLFPHLSALDNIAIAPRIVKRASRREAEQRGRELLARVGLQDKIEAYPEQLSGGQQQRVALARALVREPEVFLLDEPLSNLDAQVREATRSELKKLFRGVKATVLYVTHDQTEAMMMSDHLVVMDRGVIRQAGEPTHIYRDPAHRFVAEFIGAPRINSVPGRLENGRFQSADGTISFDTPLRGTANVLMAIRPENLAPGSQDEIRLIGETILVEPMGPANLISVKVGQTELRMTFSLRPMEGETLRFSFSSRHALFFDAQSGLRLRADP